MGKRRLLIVLTSFLSAAVLTSCGPSAYLLEVETRRPAKKEIGFEGRNLGILVNEVESVTDTLGYSSFVNSIAETFENELNIENGTLPVYRGSTEPEQFRKGLSDLDMVFVVNSVKEKDINIHDQQTDDYNEMVISTVHVVMESDFMLYDLYSGKIVDRHNGRDTVAWDVYSESDVPRKTLLKKVADSRKEVFGSYGKLMSAAYFDEWISDSRRLFVYTGNDKWEAAFSKASDFKWKDATKFWISQTSSENPKKAAAAAHNLAVACEMNGNLKLALEWLDFADRKYKTNSSILQRQIIMSKMKELKK